VCAAPPGAVSATTVARGVPVSSFVEPEATYAFAFVRGASYGAPQAKAILDQALVARGVATASGLVAAETLAVGGTGAAEGATLAEVLAGGGEALLAIEAGGGAEAEASIGPVGWIVGAIVLVAAGGLLVTAYLLSDSQPAALAPGTQPDPAASQSQPQVCQPPETVAEPATTTETQQSADERQRQCREENPTYLTACDPRTSEQVASAFATSRGIAVESVSCQNLGMRPGGTVSACGTAPADYVHCTINNSDFVVSMFGCYCCDANGDVGRSWEGVHQSDGPGETGAQRREDTRQDRRRNRERDRRRRDREEDEESEPEEQSGGQRHKRGRPRDE